MKKSPRKVLIGLGLLFCIIVVASIGVALFFDVNQYKPQIEAAVKKSSGIEMNIKGKISLKMFPRPRIAIHDIHLLNQGAEFFSAEALEMTPRLTPLLFHREIVITKLSLLSPKIQIEPTKTKMTSSEKKAGSIDAFEIRNGSLTYDDRSTNTKVEITGVNLDLSNISWDTADVMKTLAAQGDIQIQSIQIKDKTASKFKTHLQQDRGLTHLEKTEADVFGGKMKGSAELDLRQNEPRIKITQTASRIDLTQALPHVKNRASGLVDASIHLEATGKTEEAFKKSTVGRISIHGQNIHLKYTDINKVAKDIKSAQGLNLVNVASIFGNPLKSTGKEVQIDNVIEKFISSWQIKDGIAKAEDVAFSTAETSIAFKGEINLIKNSYQKFFIAAIDHNGCAKTKLEITGPLSQPRPVAGSVGRQIGESGIGSAGKAVGSTIGGIFGSNQKTTPKTSPGKDEAPSDCDLFYSGSLTRSSK